MKKRIQIIQDSLVATLNGFVTRGLDSRVFDSRKKIYSIYRICGTDDVKKGLAEAMYETESGPCRYAVNERVWAHNL